MKMHIRCFVDCLELTFALRFEQYLLTDRDLYVSAKGFVTQSVTLHSRHADPTMIEQKLLFKNRAEELHGNMNSKRHLSFAWLLHSYLRYLWSLRFTCTRGYELGKCFTVQWLIPEGMGAGGTTYGGATLSLSIFLIFTQFSVADPGFPRRGRQLLNWGKNILFHKISTEKDKKMKEIGPGGST